MKFIWRFICCKGISNFPPFSPRPLLRVVVAVELNMSMSQLSVLLFITLSTTASAFVLEQTLFRRRHSVQLNMKESDQKRGARVAFIGNSIQYFNDTPRFLARLSRQTNSHVPLIDKPYDAYIDHQNSCFRGGVSLVGLWKQGNGMLKHGYASQAAIIGIDENGSNMYDVGASTVQDLLTQQEWDFVVLNDHTQGPTRIDTRDAAIEILADKYAPLISKSKAIPIIIETAAYRLEGINNSQDLGTTVEFQQRVREGVMCYKDVLSTALTISVSPRIAPVGEAFLHVRKENFTLWEQLFDSFDNFHPSPKGTYLQGCVLFYTMFSSPPPLPQTEEEIAQLWIDARMMNCVNRTDGYETMPLPTLDEMKYFSHVAETLCNNA